MKQLGKVLLVDDDSITNFINQMLIQKMQVARSVVIATSGSEALEQIRHDCLDKEGKIGEDGIQLMLLDINMPGMNGFEVLERLEELQQSSPVKMPVIVMLTSSANQQDQLKSKEHHVTGYLVKPLSPDKVHEILRLIPE